MGFGSKKAVIEIVGMEELIRAVATIKNKTSRNAMAAGVRAAMTIVRKHIRKEINSQECHTAHAASLKAGMRKSVGGSFKKGGLDHLGRRHATIAKVGLGVGKKGEARLSRGQTEDAKGKRLGVTPETLHWFVLRTPTRSRSQVPPLFEGVVERATASAGEPSMQAAVTKAKQRFERDAARLAK
ncbi:MAG TPA: hypothetical protein VMY37_25705 [Thermoguttaceae bacterium]|nr:hypothetical protein [Thermoguttaceae bacterium]